MSWDDVFKIIVAMLASIGSASVIIFGLSSWLGKVWASRILENEKKEHTKDIALYKNQLNELKTITLRYSGKQFELYNDFWVSLCDLEYFADILIEKVDGNNWRNFVSQFEETSIKIKKGYLFIEEGHYKQLNKLLEEFRGFKIGKEKILKMNELFNKNELLKIIIKNFGHQSEYRKLTMKIGKKFKNQLKGK